MYNGGLSEGIRETEPCSNRNPLVVIVGPTGSGKSELALRVAERFQGEIVNCDSLQIYRHFDIGTAKLAVSERRGIPHHLLDVLEPHQIFTAGEYARLARAALAEISARAGLPVVTGGTGFYVRALLEGLFPGPSRDQSLRDRLAGMEARRAGVLARLLRRLDPPAAARIHCNDLPKLTRALEVCILARQPMTELLRRGRNQLEGYRVLKIGLDPDRTVLYPRLDERCRTMFDSGLLDEVRHILSLGFSPEVKPFESHGYRQALQFLREELSLKQALFYAQRNTRQYAKRQMTWFRREADLAWYRGFGGDEEVSRAVLERVEQFLAEKVL